jgi:uncharacterized protein YqeY
MKDALRARDRLRLETLRMAKSSVRNVEIDRRAELDDAGVVGVLRTLIKQRRESVEQFARGGRQDLADKEEAEARILESYLPAQLDEAAVEAVVREVIAAEGAADPKALGKVMKSAMERLQGQADGKLVNAVARRLLSGA